MPLGIVYGNSIGNVSATNTSTPAISVTQGAPGNLILLGVAWWNTAVGTQSGDVTSVTDTGNLVWTRVAPTVYSPSTVQGSLGLACFYAITTGTNAITITAHLSASFNNAPIVAVVYTNAVSPWVDASASTTGTATTPLTVSGLSPTLTNDGILLFGAWNTTAGTVSSIQIGSATSGYTLTSRLANHWFFQEYDFIGSGIAIQVAPYSLYVNTSLGSNVDWAALAIAVPGANVASYLTDSFEASAGYPAPFDELYFLGEIFVGGYTGMAWLKNAYCIPRDFWDAGAYSRSTPYAGQLFPVGPGQGTPGQIYPY